MDHRQNNKKKALANLNRQQRNNKTKHSQIYVHDEVMKPDNKNKTWWQKYDNNNTIFFAAVRIWKISHGCELQPWGYGSYFTTFSRIFIDTYIVNGDI